MSNNQLVPAEKKLPIAIKQKDTDILTPVITYSLLDPMHYSFSYNVEDTITIRMEEAENTTAGNGYVDVEFDDSVPDSHKVYYAVAAASGVLTGALCFIKLTEEQLASINEWKEKNWKPLVIYAAEMIGYQKKDYKSASKYLVNQAVKRVNADGTTKEYMTLLTAHPTMAGLLFSLITQFAEKSIYISESGEIKLNNLPEHYCVGCSNGEKIVAAVMYWLYELAANQAESKRNLIDNLGLSGELLKKIKAFINLPILKNIPDNREQADIAFSEWLHKVIQEAGTETNREENEDANLVKQLMKIALNIGSDAFPVLVNDCIVHSLYMVIRICDVVKVHQIVNIAELRDIPVTEILPADDRLLSGMCLASSASFATMNLSVAALKAIAAVKTGDRKFLPAFISELNIPAVGRLIFAIVKDSKFWGDDIKLVFQRQPKEKSATEFADEEDFDEEAFATLSLSPEQARILYCLENLVVRKDIERTKDKTIAEKKQLWLQNWRYNIVAGANIDANWEEKFFLEDEDRLYDGIYMLSKDKDNYAWFYLLTQELSLYKPYFTLGCEHDDEFKKLKQEYDYVSDQFIRRQTIVSQAELENMQSTYKKYSDYMSGKVVRTISTIAGGTAVTALTGGLALAYAPAIAAMIAGEAVVGLHGAALASASLAFVGGGSLAAGGLGMAGGTAIITGGGALLGLAGSGGTSAVVALMSTSDEYWMRQGAKLLTHCRCTLVETLNLKMLTVSMLKQVEIAEKHIVNEIAELKQEDNDLDKEYLKHLDSYLGCLKKVRTELQKLTK